MTRLRLPVGRRVLLACLVLVALVLLIPLGLAIDAFGLTERGLAARAARGSVWAGTLEEARFGQIALGDVKARLRVLPLLAGRARLDLKSVNGQSGVTVTRHGFGIDDATATVTLASLLSPLPPVALYLADVSAAFREGRCERAEGRVTARLTAALAGLQLGGGLTGAARCDAGALLLPLVGQSGLDTLTLRITGDGHFRAELDVRSADPALAARLTAAGFAPAPDGVVLRVAGRL